MELYNLNYLNLNLADKWECTYKIFKLKGVVPTKLSDCAKKFHLDLEHHNALSDVEFVHNYFQLLWNFHKKTIF